jgi:hypothetical protein
MVWPFPIRFVARVADTPRAYAQHSRPKTPDGTGILL